MWNPMCNSQLDVWSPQTFLLDVVVQIMVLFLEQPLRVNDLHDTTAVFIKLQLLYRKQFRSHCFLNIWKPYGNTNKIGPHILRCFQTVCLVRSPGPLRGDWISLRVSGFAWFPTQTTGIWNEEIRVGNALCVRIEGGLALAWARPEDNLICH